MRRWVAWGVSGVLLVGCASETKAPAAKQAEGEREARPEREAKPEPEPEPEPAADPDPAPAPEADAVPEPAGEPSDLQINLKIIEGERSRDSHQSTFRCSVDDAKVTYYGPHGECERGRCPHKEVTFELSGSDRDALAAKLKELGLLERFSEKAGTDGTGSYVSARLQSRFEGQSGMIEVAGMITPFGGGAAKTLSEDATAWKGKVGSLRMHLTSLARVHLPDAL